MLVEPSRAIVLTLATDTRSHVYMALDHAGLACESVAIEILTHYSHHVAAAGHCRFSSLLYMADELKISDIVLSPHSFGLRRDLTYKYNIDCFTWCS